ncbi:MAG: hypothetical protein ABSF22_22490 [Bryobacteraceae bacterium]
MLTKSAFAILTGCLLSATSRAGSITIDIDATVSGCSQCSGVAQVTPGTFLTDIYSPQQVALGAGTYTVTNGDPLAIGGTPDKYSAWNFEGPVSGNWVWSFVIATDNGSGTQGTVLLDDYIAGVYATQALAASATGIVTYDNLTALTATSTAGFVDTFTLTAPATVDLLIDDYGLYDNAGGVALTISGSGIGSTVPEPSSFLPLGLALLVVKRLTSATK